MSPTKKLLAVVAILALVWLVAIWLEADWSGVAWAVLAVVGLVQTIVLASGAAPSFLSGTSVVESLFLTIGLSSWAVREFFRSALPESASVALTVGGFVLVASALVVGRRRSGRVGTTTA